MKRRDMEIKNLRTCQECSFLLMLKMFVNLQGNALCFFELNLNFDQEHHKFFSFCIYNYFSEFVNLLLFSFNCISPLIHYI